MQALRIATFQRRPRFDEVAAISAQLLADLLYCDVQGVQLVLFPECYLQGYASDRAIIMRRAWDLQGEEFQQLLASCSTIRACFILGLIERRGGRFYNTAVVVQGGELLGSYAKVHTNEAGFDAGSDTRIAAQPDDASGMKSVIFSNTRPNSAVFDIGNWRVGINICNDANFPAAAMALREHGAQLICYPLNNLLALDTANIWRDRHLDNLVQRARETRCWVMSSDVSGQSGSKLAYGCTAILRPDGSLLAQVPELQEGMLMAELCLDGPECI